MEKGTELAGCVVMIPALDPGPDLAAYAAALLARGPEALVVVDDGSGPPALLGSDRTGPV